MSCRLRRPWPGSVWRARPGRVTFISCRMLYRSDMRGVQAFDDWIQRLAPISGVSAECTGCGFPLLAAPRQVMVHTRPGRQAHVATLVCPFCRAVLRHDIDRPTADQLVASGAIEITWAAGDLPSPAAQTPISESDLRSWEQILRTPGWLERAAAALIY